MQIVMVPFYTFMNILCFKFSVNIKRNDYDLNLKIDCEVLYLK